MSPYEFLLNLAAYLHQVLYDDGNNGLPVWGDKKKSRLRLVEVYNGLELLIKALEDQNASEKYGEIIHQDYPPLDLANLASNRADTSNNLNNLGYWLWEKRN